MKLIEQIKSLKTPFEAWISWFLLQEVYQFNIMTYRSLNSFLSRRKNYLRRTPKIGHTLYYPTPVRSLLIDYWTLNTFSFLALVTQKLHCNVVLEHSWQFSCVRQGRTGSEIVRHYKHLIKRYDVHKDGFNNCRHWWFCVYSDGPFQHSLQYTYVKHINRHRRCIQWPH